MHVCRLVLKRYSRLLGLNRNLKSMTTMGDSFANAEKNGLQPHTTAGIIVIGDEILKGFTRDTNSHFLARELFKKGVKVHKISVVADDAKAIVAEVRQFSKSFDYVLTSGGVGPTHDDITYESIAAAFDDECVENAELGALVRKYFKIPSDDHSAIQLKLCRVPKRAHLLWGVHRGTGTKSLYPVVRVENVTIFPGIPRLLERGFDMIESFFQPLHSSSGFTAYNTYLSCGEFEVAATLGKTQAKYSSLVNIGSYPKLDHSYYMVKVSVDSSSQPIAQKVTEELRSQFPDHMVHYDPEPLKDGLEKFDNYRKSLMADTSTQGINYLRLVDEATAIIRDIFSKYDVESQCCLSFNGGKDCTLLLHLMHVEMLRKYGTTNYPKLKAIYVQPGETFADVEKFVDETVKRYNIDVMRIKGGLKDALTHYKQIYPDREAVFMGTRIADFRGRDPGDAADVTVLTDADWPRYLRVQPIISMNYHSVWRFLRDLFLPYCSLYDRGYTSLGCKETTYPNEALKYKDGFGRTVYRPAHKLEDENLERVNRRKQNRL